MPYSTAWENMHQSSTMLVMTDINPWAGVSIVRVIENARVESIDYGVGANFDQANLLLNEDFGNELQYFQPIKIISIIGSGEDTIESVLFRGFVVKNSGNLSAAEESVRVTCYGYKWYLSKRIRNLRGRWYATEDPEESTFGVASAMPTLGITASGPDSIGSGLSIGAEKFTYERFRADPQNLGGFIQNEELVFNKDNIPDCASASWNNTLDVFYRPSVPWNELKNLRAEYWNNQKWNGKYWKWSSIFSHLEYYWLEPFFGQQARVEFSQEDLHNISQITDDKDKPLNLSLQGLNLCTAIDTIVKKLPGKWYWFMDYRLPTIKIRIKNFEEDSEEVYLQVCDGGKVATSGANVTSLTVSRDASEAAKYAIATGGSIKLLTTVKMHPLWPRYGTNGDRDFKDDADKKKYARYIRKVFYESSKNKDENVPEDISEEDRKRYDKVYRYYGVALDGDTFGDTMVGQDYVLTGKPATHYSTYETNIKNMFFKNCFIEKKITAPGFGKFMTEPAVFLYDNWRDGVKRSSDGLTRKALDTTNNTYQEMEATDDTRANRWIIPRRDDISYKFDAKSGTILFDKPQFMRGNDLGENDSGSGLFGYVQEASLTASLSSYTRLQSRKVYLTATFSTSVAAIFGKATDNTIIDNFSGAPFPVYIKNKNQDIIYHFDAYYPLIDVDPDTQVPKLQDEMDGNRIFDKIRRCDYFDGYNEYIGTGAEELLRCLQSFLEGYTDFKEEVSAVIPWIEIGPMLGDKLNRIHNTEYSDLDCRLMKIGLSLKGDGDFYNTTLTFSNNYVKQGEDDNYVSPLGETNLETLNERNPYKVN